MFCFQCEQTSKGTGCDIIGVCGKRPDVAALQDLLIHSVRGLSVVAKEAIKKGIRDEKMDLFVCEAIFSTLTNVDFDPDRFVKMIEICSNYTASLSAKAGIDVKKCSECDCTGKTKGQLVALGEKVGVKADPNLNEDIR